MFGFNLSGETTQLATGSGYGWQRFSPTSQPSGFKVAYEGGDFIYRIYEKDGEYRFGCSYRADPVIYDEMTSPDKDVIERWFIKMIGDEYRAYNHLPQILLPYYREEIKEGYELVPLGNADYALRRPDGTLVDVHISDDNTDVFLSVEYSHVADLPVRDLARSYLDPEGLPLMADYLCSNTAL